MSINRGYDIILYLGSDLTIAWTGLTGATFTSATPTFRVSRTPGGNAIFEKTSGSGITVVSDTAVTITIDEADFDDPGLYYHGLQQNLAGATTLIATGRVVVRGAPQDI